MEKGTTGAVNSEAALFTPPVQAWGKTQPRKAGFGHGKSNYTMTSIPSAGDRAGVGYRVLASPWGIVKDISDPASLLGVFSGC